MARINAIRTLVMERDRTMLEYQVAHQGLDIALSTLYTEYGMDRLQIDIDLETGEFIPYANGRAPNIPPTFRKD